MKSTIEPKRKDFGKVEFSWTGGDEGYRRRSIYLTLVGPEDDGTMHEKGLAALRHRRIIRLTHEAEEQGMLLSYEDLCVLLNISVSTLKRDLRDLERKGFELHLRNRRKRGALVRSRAAEENTEAGQFCD